MKHIYIFLNILLIATIMAFASCGKQADSKPVAIAVDSLKILADSLTTPEEREFMTRIYEEKMTEDDKKQLKLMYLVMGENLIIKDGYIKLNLSKEDYLKTGLSIGSYYRLLLNIRDNNSFIDSMKLDVEEIFNEMIAVCNEAQKL